MILVFGKTGQVGKELLALKDVKALDRAQVDLSDPQACAKIIAFSSPQAVINAAAYTAVDKAENEEDLANTINGDTPGAMSMACADLNIPFVHISTDYVFDGKGTAPWSITDIKNPQNAYGRSKLRGEQAIESSGCTYAILRTSWVVSAHGSNFVKKMLSLSKTRDLINVVDDQVGGPTCARDIANTCLCIVEQLLEDSNKSGIYHYTGQPDVSWCQFANVIFKKRGCKTIANPIATTDYPALATRPLNSRLNCTLTEDSFGITRPYWEDGLEEIFRDMESDHEKT